MNDTGGGVTTDHTPCDPVIQEPVTLCDSLTVISNRHKNLESARALFFPLPTGAHALARTLLPIDNGGRNAL